jgi:hypothetical protein
MDLEERAKYISYVEKMAEEAAKSAIEWFKEIRFRIHYRVF